MKKFEYKTEFFETIETDRRYSEFLTNSLNGHGNKGWELVAAESITKWGPTQLSLLGMKHGLVCIFKRSINEEEQ